MPENDEDAWPVFTPTEDDVAGAYMMERGRIAISFSESQEEFDRWLAARDRENRAIGWDEGWDRGVSYERWNESEDATNPYRGDKT